MGFWDWLFGKKKKDRLGEDDGQAQYFKEDFGSKPAKSTEAVIKKSTTEAVINKKSTAEAVTNNKEEEITKRVVKAEKPKKTDSVKKVVSETIPELTEESPEVKTADTIKESKPTVNGRFDIKKAKDGRYFFCLYASNGLVIAYSQMYSSLSAVNNGIKSVIANMDKAGIEDTTLKKTTSLPCPKWEIYIDKAGEYRFRLYATNGQCVCHSSHGYKAKSGCKGGIESIRRFAKISKIDKSYLQ